MQQSAYIACYIDTIDALVVDQEAVAVVLVENNWTVVFAIVVCHGMENLVVFIVGVHVAVETLT
jgi:hypothetical protein